MPKFGMDMEDLYKKTGLLRWWRACQGGSYEAVLCKTQCSFDG